MAESASILYENGKLFVGQRWDRGRFRASELVIDDNAKLTVNGNMVIYTGCAIGVCENAELSLGSGYINNGAKISVFEKVTIGQDVAISENVTIRDSDNHEISGANGPSTAPINIGDKVWIGINVTILKGVTVGDGAVIAAGSLVNKNIPPRTLVGGVPAKVLRENVEWS